VAGRQNELAAHVRLVNKSHSWFPVLQIATALDLSDGISEVQKIHIFKCLIIEEFPVPVVQYSNVCVCVGNWWNDIDRGNRYTGRKTLYSVDGRWMNEYGAMVEWYWQGKTEVLGEKHYTVWVVDGWMSMEQWWNDIDRGILKCWEKNIIQRGW